MKRYLTLILIKTFQKFLLLFEEELKMSAIYTR